MAAERAEPPEGTGVPEGGGGASSASRHKKKSRATYPPGVPVVDVGESFELTVAASGAKMRVSRTGEHTFACMMPACVTVFQLGTKNLVSMENHATAKHALAVADDGGSAAASSSIRAAGDTITVAVSFGKVGDAIISKDFEFTVEESASCASGLAAKCGICSRVLLSLAHHQLGKHCNSDHPTEEVVVIRAKAILATKQATKQAKVQASAAAARASTGGGLGKFFKQTVREPEPVVRPTNPIPLVRLSLPRAPAPTAPALVRQHGIVATLRAALPESNIYAGYMHGLPDYPYVLHASLALAWEASTDGTLRANARTVREAKCDALALLVCAWIAARFASARTS